MKDTTRFVEFLPVRPNKDNTKMVPAKVKDLKGREFTFGRDAKQYAEDGPSMTTEYEIEFEETQNGKYLNRVLTSIKAAAEAPTMNPRPSPTATIIPQAQGSDRDRLILRQVALKAGVEWATGRPIDAVLTAADTFNDWLNGVTAEQQAARTALATGGSYSAALGKPHVSTTLKPNQSLAEAVDEVLAEDILAHIPPADARRETVGPKGASR